LIGFGAMLSYIRRQIGLRTDAASATGSVHAKVKEARDVLLAEVQRAPWKSGKAITLVQGYMNSNVTGDGAYHDIFRISGPVHILGGYLSIYSASNYLQVDFNINGVTLWSNFTASMASQEWNRWSKSSIDKYANGPLTIFPQDFTGIGDDNYARQDASCYIQTIPPGLYINSSMFARYVISSGNNLSLIFRWCFWTIPV
jgi:hypothetical protein